MSPAQQKLEKVNQPIRSSLGQRRGNIPENDRFIFKIMLLTDFDVQRTPIIGKVDLMSSIELTSKFSEGQTLFLGNVSAIIKFQFQNQVLFFWNYMLMSSQICTIRYRRCLRSNIL